MAQLSTIRTEVLETAGLSSSDSRFPTATLNRVINRALRRVSAEMHWPWLQASQTLTTATNTQAYSPAANWSQTIRLRYESRNLQNYQSRDAAQYFNSVGAPIGFFIEEDEIHFVPTPDGVYSIEHVYLKDEAELSGDTDEPSLPARYTDFLVAHALLLVSQMIRDEGLYGMADRERKMWLQRMADEARRSTSTVRIKTRNDLGI